MLVLGIGSGFLRSGWALVEARPQGEHLVLAGLLEAVDAEVVAEFAGTMANREPPITSVVIEDCEPEDAPSTVKLLARLVGRWQQAFEALGLETRIVTGEVWQRGILTGLVSGRSPTPARRAAAVTWAEATYAESLAPDLALAAGIATWELRQRARAARGRRETA